MGSAKISLLLLLILILASLNSCTSFKKCQDKFQIGERFTDTLIVEKSDTTYFPVYHELPVETLHDTIDCAKIMTALGLPPEPVKTTTGNRTSVTTQQQGSRVFVACKCDAVVDSFVRILITERTLRRIDKDVYIKDVKAIKLLEAEGKLSLVKWKKRFWILIVLLILSNISNVWRLYRKFKPGL